MSNCSHFRAGVIVPPARGPGQHMADGGQLKLRLRLLHLPGCVWGHANDVKNLKLEHSRLFIILYILVAPSDWGSLVQSTLFQKNTVYLDPKLPVHRITCIRVTDAEVLESTAGHWSRNCTD